jgi:DNA-binding transcriptional LysR family regulator
MDIRHARTFVTIAELGSVSKAALRLRIAQPALSRQLSNLEAELRLKLFDRFGRRLALTGEGEQLLGECRNLLRCANAVGEQAQLLRRGDTGVLKVSGSPQVIESVFSGFLHRYAKRYPNVEVKLIEAVGTQTLRCIWGKTSHIRRGLLMRALRTTRWHRCSYWPFPISP